MNLGQDWEVILQIANRRRENNRTSWHIDRKYMEVIGVAGELAARRFLGLPEVIHEHFDGGRDFVWRGLPVDVKSTKLTPHVDHRFLQWPINKTFKAKIVLMMGIDMERKLAAPLGWAYASEVQEAQINNEREYPCYEIPVTDLRPAWMLFTIQSQNPKESKTLPQSVSP